MELEDCLKILITLKTREDCTYLFEEFVYKPHRVPDTDQTSDQTSEANEANKANDDGMIPALWRRDLTQWIHACVMNFDVPAEVEPLAISYMDRFLASLSPKERVRDQGALLCALTSIHLAMSISCGSGLSIPFQTLLDETGATYFNSKTVMSMHVWILRNLRFAVHPPTTLEYLHCFSILMNQPEFYIDKKSFSEDTNMINLSMTLYLEDQANMLAGVALQSSDFVKYPRHKVALCCLGVMMEYACMFETDLSNSCRLFLVKLGELLGLDIHSFMEAAEWEIFSSQNENISRSRTLLPRRSKSASEISCAASHHFPKVECSDIRIIRAMLWKIVLEQNPDANGILEDCFEPKDCGFRPDIDDAIMKKNQGTCASPASVAPLKGNDPYSIEQESLHNPPEFDHVKTESYNRATTLIWEKYILGCKKQISHETQCDLMIPDMTF